MTGKYHVVCHDCPTEQVLDGRDAARTVQTSHAEETTHRISCLQIDGPLSTD